MRGGNQGFRPLVWDPNEQRIYVRTDRGVYSGTLADITFKLAPTEGIPDTVVVFDPSAKIPGAVVANALIRAVREAEHNIIRAIDMAEARVRKEGFQ